MNEVMKYFYPIWIVAILIEYFIDRKKNLRNYPLNECLSSLTIHILHRSSGLIYPILFAPIYLWLNEKQLFDLNFDPYTTIIVYFFLTEFIYYWTHRMSHHISLDWCSHITHHSMTKLNFLSGSRVGITGPFAFCYFISLAFVAIGFRGDIINLFLKLNLLYQIFLHTEMIPKIYFFDHFMNTPSNHRVHHGLQDIYFNKNFGGFTIIFDRFFGTYQEEQSNKKPIYGVVNGTSSQNPIYLCFFGWGRFFRKIYQEFSAKIPYRYRLIRFF